MLSRVHYIWSHVLCGHLPSGCAGQGGYDMVGHDGIGTGACCLIVVQQGEGMLTSR